MNFGFQFNIKLKSQIIFGYLILLLLIIILITSMIYSLRSLDVSSERILKENYISITSGQNMALDLQIMNEISAGLVKTRNDSLLASKFELCDNDFTINYKIVNSNITELGEKEILEKIKEEYEQYIETYNYFKKNNYSQEIYFNNLLQSYSFIRNEVASLIDLNYKASLSKNEKSRRDFNIAWIYLIIISGFTILIAYITIIKIPSAILKPLDQLTKEISSISEGNYGHTIDIISKNELGSLISAFNQMSRKLAEYEKSNMAIIIAQKSRIESIVNSLNDAIIILDENKNFVLVNPKAMELLGISDNKLTNKSAAEASVYNNLLRELLRMLDQKEIVNNDRYLRISVNGREEYYTKEFIEVKNVVNQDANKLLGYVIELKNVTAFKELDDTKSNFIATLSHEIKTPLSAMNMSLNLLLNKKIGEMNSEQENIAVSMKNEIQRLLAIIADLLDLSKFEVGHIKINFQKVDAKFIMNYSLSPFYNEIKEKEIELISTVEERIPEFKADPEKISWVLMNLISNAIRYTPKKERLEIEVKCSGNFIEFCVADSGPGIEDKYADRIFEKYFQVPGKEYENQDGLGLGLAICKEIIISHGGKIWVKNSEEKGSRFYFTLPIIKN